ncbi:aspartyl-tRNA(Asn)/glutamyl-tRNA(Gln) amidotransferase subunit A [Kribbella amoyensis]|uniref:Aspartyl-tRNA(Asn)/glutamyl-tRNA(Gln) amidotransferase subunit A n=1 Tax=Kribbella amoyensis TaxID=996641 RepID=A0A561BUW9_9ACTN|nr:amidase [Kribbella amoyensis]TWD82648.1 aspartyl-tRNA(Asn)/glutamyl-tRNA(Gln) amidotransferase subunit A [Kribbella amoyensis]
MNSPGTDSIVTLARALRRGDTTSAELVDQALSQIHHQNPILNAFVLVTGDDARKAARVADEELAAGIDRGPLHGIPFAVKDLVDVAGLPTTCGSATSFGGPASVDADVVKRLRDCGAVLVGKTTLHEFAYGATGDRSVHGPSRNPHDPGRMSGGSSGGSAVAVASGMVPLALGTDTAGSVRVPAALCGVAGFKPAYDAISSTGVYPLAPSLDHVGLFAGSSEDTRVAYEAIVGRRLPGAGERLKVGWIPPGEIAVTDPRVEAVGSELVHRAGFEVASVPWSFDLALFDVFSTLQGKEAYNVHAGHLGDDRDRVDPEVLARLDRGRGITSAEYARADQVRREFRAIVDELLAGYDVLALPTVPVVAPPIGARSVTVDGTELEVRAALLSLTSPWNLAGVPAVSVPVGAVDGLPVAVQLVSAVGNEHLLFAAARSLESPLDRKDT